MALPPGFKETGWFNRFGGSVRMAPTEDECYPRSTPTWSSAETGGSGFSDFNGDWAPDVLVRSKQGELWFLPGGRTVDLLGTGGWNAFNALVRHGDFSQDGQEDVIAREASTGKLWFYPGKAGTYGSRVLIGGGWSSMTSFLAVGDYTGDGHNDLAAITGVGTSAALCPAGDGCLLIYPGTGTGKLGPPLARPTTGGT
ncbi:FG-GAP repeat domain-containing protein [Streptomyces sp. NPDC056264]|uniref:FG-GAP repeat domain-containing protein n=1 Tax=Streptomyces sp. NPDC056264 TaxID=3345767 RepID=UPI003AADB9F9